MSNPDTERETLPDDDPGIETTPETLEDDDPAHEEMASEGVRLPDGLSLDPVALRGLKLAVPVRTVAFVGASNSGKTTLLSAVYDAFCAGEFAGCVFAGSQTILGFEKRLHLSRLVSGRTDADTERTRTHEDLAYLHIALVDANGKERHVAFADRAGETYGELPGTTALDDVPVELRKSDHLVFLVDGALLADPQEMANAIGSARSLFRKLKDLGALGRQMDITFAITKADKLVGHPRHSTIDGALGRMERGLERFREEVRSLSFVRTAVRQEGDGPAVDLPVGLADLLRSWVGDSDTPRGTAPVPVMRREYDRMFGRDVTGGREA